MIFKKLSDLALRLHSFGFYREAEDIASGAFEVDLGGALDTYVSPSEETGFPPEEAPTEDIVPVISMDHPAAKALFKYFDKVLDVCSLAETRFSHRNINLAAQYFTFHSKDLRDHDRYDSQVLIAAGDYMSPEFTLKILSYTLSEYIKRNSEKVNADIISCMREWALAIYSSYMDYYQDYIDPSYRERIKEEAMRKTDEAYSATREEQKRLDYAGRMKDEGTAVE